MDRFDIMAHAGLSPTIVIQPYMIYAAGGVVLVISLLLSAKPFIAMVNRREEAIRTRCAAEKAKEEQAEQKRLAKLYPAPWLSVYNDCEELNQFQQRMILFNAWLSQEGSAVFPHLSMDAIYDMARMVAGYSPGGFRNIAEKLSPYLAFKNETPSTNGYGEGDPRPKLSDRHIERYAARQKEILAAKRNEDNCERHPDVPIINNCSQCGAPQCCPTCCNEAERKAYANICIHCDNVLAYCECGQREYCIRCTNLQADCCC